MVRLYRSSVDEVIGLLSAPTADGGFEDEGVRRQQFDPAQFDSWRNSLTKVKAVPEMCLSCATRHGLVCATSIAVMSMSRIFSYMDVFFFFDQCPCLLPSFCGYESTDWSVDITISQ